MKKHCCILVAALLWTISVSSQNVGINTTTPKASFNVAADNTVLFGNDTSGGGGKLMWLPSKYAFRAGGVGPVSNNQLYFNEDPLVWDADSIGSFSFAGGYGNKAIGQGSTGFGAINTMRGWFSTALGYRNTVNTDLGFAVGSENVCSGGYAIAMGNHNVVTTTIGCAIGNQNNITADFNSFAIGSINTCTSFNSLALGYHNTSSNLYAVAIGAYHDVQSLRGSSLGENSINNSAYCTIVGSSNLALPTWSPDSWRGADPIFIIGNGHTSETRSNALVVLKNGRAGFGTNAPEALIHGVFNSSPGVPQLLLEESSTDYARITMKNSNPGYWDIAAFCQPFLGSNASAKMNFYFSQFGNVLSLKGNGNATLSGTLTQNSDERLKTNIHPLQQVLPRLMNLNGYTYQWKDSERDSTEQIGLIAQELEKEFPQLIATDENGIKSIAYGNMAPLFLEAIKDLQAQIVELRQQLKEK